MSNQNTYKPKVWNAICDSCGLKRKSSELRKRWDGAMVCADTCWEPRHPQDFLRAIKETSNKLPWTRPDTDGADVGPNYITLYVKDGYVEEQQPAPPGVYFEEPYA